MLLRALVYCLEVNGVAASQVKEETRKRMTDIPW